MLLLYDACHNPGFLRVVLLIMNVVKMICIIAPIILIVMLSIDMAKNVISGDEEETRKTLKKSIKRVIACALIFFVPLIVNVVVNMLGDLGVDYVECINNANTETINQLLEQKHNQQDTSNVTNYNNGNNNSNSNNSNNSNDKTKKENKYNYTLGKDFIVLGHYYDNKINKTKIAIYDSKGKRVSNKKFDFNIEKPIASVNENGKVSAIFTGKTTITASLKEDPSFKLKITLVVIKSTYTKVHTTTNVKGQDLKTGKYVNIPKGTDGIFNGASMDLPQAHKRIIYYHGDVLKVGNNYYGVPYTSVKAYQYSVSHPYSAETAEEFINSNGFNSATKYLFWISLGTQTDYLFKYQGGKWKLYKQFDINTGDVLGLNPGSNGGNCNGSTHDSTYASGLGQCNSIGTTSIGHCYLYKQFKGHWLHVSYAVFTGNDASNGYCVGTFHEGFSTPKYPKSHGCIRHRKDDMIWIRDHMSQLGGSRIINF